MRYISDTIKRRGDARVELINRIVDLEWDMFDQVSNAGGRATCQDDEWTFYVMRFSQFASFDEATLRSYEQDILQAQREGRNVITEKYGYMMEYTDPAYFDHELKHILPAVTYIKSELVDRIANLLLGFERTFDERYPRLYSKGRPLMGTQAADVSFHIYTIGELKTYSEQTLNLYYKYIAAIDSQDVMHNPSFVIHRITTEFYGYKSLDDAEARI